MKSMVMRGLLILGLLAPATTQIGCMGGNENPQPELPASIKPQAAPTPPKAGSPGAGSAAEQDPSLAGVK